MSTQYSDTKSANILITGASGMIGSALRAHLEASGYQVYALERQAGDAPFFYDQTQQKMSLSSDIPLQAVINLAGANLAQGRWNDRRKQTILESRTLTTRILCQELAKLPHKPATLLSASAIGFYGDTGQSVVDETGAAGSGFLATVAQQWEQEAQAAVDAGIRTVLMRFGLVLSASGGVLANFVMPMRLAVVGAVGNGQQLMSWISLPDAVSLIDKTLHNDGFSGAINVVARDPVSNQEFSRTLGQVLHRPRLPPLPAAVVRLMFGEMGDEALLSSTGVRSSRQQELGFELSHPTLRHALSAVLA